MVRELERAGGQHFTLPLASKNPLTIRRNAGRLARLIRHYGVDIIHARSRAPAWSAYWAARRVFIDSGRTVRPSADPAAMLDQVEDPLLRVLRTSPDFRPAYEPLLRLAMAVAGSDPSRAARLLEELASLQPARHEAADALAAIGGRP